MNSHHVTEDPSPYHYHRDPSPHPLPSFSEHQPVQEKRTVRSFMEDLLERARRGDLDPLVGRDRELERVIYILNRRTKRNPILVGDPGVGKTAIVYGLAQRISEGQVPFSLQQKRIYALNLSSLVAGTMFRGDFEARLEAVIKEIRGESAILFIDEIHNVVGAGQAMGTLDAANILKPALAEGYIQVIGSTTFEEYKFYIENDKALERRFQPVFIQEPSVGETAQILQGLRSRYEGFHRIKITQEAIQAAATLANRYFQDRFLPDKAIDVLDEACVGAAISKGGSQEVKKVTALRAHAAMMREKKESYLNQGRYEEAFALKREEELLLKRATAVERTFVTKSRPLQVTERDVRKVVSTMTGVPVEELSLVELRKLRNLEADLASEVLGQPRAISALTGAIRRARVGFNFASRPLGSFVFIGHSGVGKTELARVLARKLFGSHSFIKLDMSEFAEPHSISRLIGAPAGYVGYGRGGELTEKVRRNSYSLVLFDEIEKAHPQIYNLLLQVLEDGELSDAMGLEVDFRNTIIILTANEGGEAVFPDKREIGFGTDSKPAFPYDESKKRAVMFLREWMRPELLNRIDDVIVFNPLSRRDIRSVASLQLKQLAINMGREKDARLSYSGAVVDWIAGKAFQPGEGARLVRRTIEKEILDPLAQKIVSGKFRTSRSITLEIVADALVIEE